MSEKTTHNETEAAHGTGHHLEHKETLYSEAVFRVGDFPVTNSLLNSWMTVILVVILALLVRKGLKTVPGKIQSVFEIVFEKFLELFDSITHSREKTMKLAPISLSFFFFILLNNWLGILPGVGSIGRIVSEEGHQAFVPLFRGGTADLNTTMAIAIIAVVASHILGVVSLGLWYHFNKFVNLNSLIEIPRKFRSDPTIIIVNPIKMFVGLIEIIGEVAKVASLSFRLFGNIFAGEVLLASMAAIMAFALPIPFIFMEFFIGIIQALIFAILVFIYLNIHITKEEH
jgi:F-type H+-transporting ATPase subunit a